jgi:uncharacterized protein DUF5678
MTPVQLLGSENQKPQLSAALWPTEALPEGGGWLGNLAIQSTSGHLLYIASRPRRRTAFRPLQGHRSRELEWRRTHGEILQAYSGQWVVLEGDRVVAHGYDPVGLIAEARAQGIEVPYVFRVEDSDEDLVSIGL